jgi:hypothetical protein
MFLSFHCRCAFRIRQLPDTPSASIAFSRLARLPAYWLSPAITDAATLRQMRCRHWLPTFHDFLGFTPFSPFRRQPAAFASEAAYAGRLLLLRFRLSALLIDMR